MSTQPGAPRTSRTGRTGRVAIGVADAVALTALGTARVALGDGHPAAPARTLAPTQPAPAPVAPAQPAPAVTQNAARPEAPAAAPATAAGRQVTEFGFVTASARRGGTVRITVDRAEFLTGAAARTYYAAHPELEPLDFAVVNENTRLRSYVLAADATLTGTTVLGDGTSTPRPALVADLLASSGRRIAVDLVHDGSADGPVTRLAERCLP